MLIIRYRIQYEKDGPQVHCHHNCFTMILAYALMPGISVHDPKVGIVNVPNWYVLYANLTNTPSITQLPDYLRSKFIVLSYMAWTGK